MFHLASSQVRVALGLSLCLALVGCGDDDGSGASSGTGGSGAAGGAGAQGGGGEGGSDGEGIPVTAGSKPQCEDPANVGVGATPDPRYTAEMALSADGRTAVLFGGDKAAPVCPGFPVADHLGDTWLLDVACGNYTELTGNAPSDRARHAMVSDWDTDRAILFGGRFRAGTSGVYTLYNDVWAFDFASQTWNELPSSGTPPAARQGMGAAIANGELFVFGGNVSTSGVSFDLRNDLYAYDLSTGAWREITAGGTPPTARYLTAMTYEEASNSLYVYGGSGSAAFFGDLWRFDLGTEAWSQVTANPSAITNPKRFSHALVARQQTEEGDPAVFVFGGHDDGVEGTRNDVMSVAVPDGDAWELVRPGDVLNNPDIMQCDFPADFMAPDLESPERRFAPAHAASRNGAGFAIFGGGADCGRLNDTWWFDSITGAWTPIRETLPGLSCLHTGSSTCEMLCP